MELNEIKPAKGSKRARRRVGRGIGSGLGKTCGRGHKGQKSRAGGFHKVGFEGGQMPFHRRLPKRGFKSLSKPFQAQIRLSDLEKLPVTDIDLAVLKNVGLVGVLVRYVRIIASGNLTKKVTISGLTATQGAKRAIEALSGVIN